MHHALTLGPETLHALPSGALSWPARRLLTVSDLHLGKSARLARRAGALLPPYDTRATLARLDADIEAARPATVVCLGDSFDDLAAADSLDEADALWLSRLMAGRDWVWMMGNHDPGPVAIGGSHRAELTLGALTFRHIADPGQCLEISGHYHPKAQLAGTSHPCFLADTARIILPAYGAYTGGLRCTDPALTALMQPGALAILTGRKALAIPMPR
ncbi:ligase-associated DNA damage response endonuclease PdeM [Rhodobacter sp. Har01]|uniref:ligase-associated DNA damage response endonuclease PdeM n=1 Tax=Rhodobacter sp. Har01 TaxID=2883999 RepID=UPI001D05CE08|nr:ligase-associated DNA damage response endonuclease PdeM [Rhodobacter sp. Har01]MCB6178399.1 ligase-associated DNA damage response endonuclease PdeM [Rhodobacter sp. Har01]